MGSDKINIVIVDHQTFGATLSKHLKEAGFEPILTRKSSDAVREFGVRSVHAFIIECVLPGSSGADLVKDLKKAGASKVPFYFMSGLFKSQDFIKKTLADTGGEGFFEKPLNYEHIVKTLKEKFKIQSVSKDNNSMMDLMINKDMDDNNCLEMLQSTEKIYGYDIPLLISVISRTDIMGVARFSSKNDMAKVYISKGNIISVISNDTSSYWGTLLLEKNLITPEELKINLSKNDKNKIGTRLIEANLISPHIVDLICLEQACIRVGRMIKDTWYSFSFTNFNVSQTDSMRRCNSTYTTNRFLSEWIHLKTPIEFLRQIYIPYLQYRVVKSSNYKNRNSFLSVPYIRHDAGILELLSNEDCVLSDFLSSKEEDQEIYRLIHYLVSTDIITFKQNNHLENFESRIEVLNKFKKDIEKQNYFQILGINAGKDFDEYSLKSSYISLTKSFHPDKLIDAPLELKSISNEIFNIISEAYNVLIDPKKRKQYESNIESAKADMKLSLDNLLSDAKKHLKNYQATKAYDLLQQASKMQKPSTEVKLYLLWARIAKTKEEEIEQNDLMEIWEVLNHIPVEDRNTALYYFVKGLLQKKIGDFDVSELNFKKAILFDDKFIVAKGELKKVEKLKKSKFISMKLGNAKQQLKDIFFKDKQKKAS